MNGNPKVNVEEILMRPDGTRIVMLVNKVPLRDKQGNCIGILGTSVDITERKKLEEDLSAAKEYAEAMNRMKTEFLSNMSHDIKTPLAGIIGNAELLLRKTKEGKARESLSEIMECGHTLLRFFDNCLELSKLENADLTLISERFKLKELIWEVVSLFKPAVKSKNLELNIYYDDNIPDNLLGNRAALFRVLQNLIGNAVKFTYQGGVKVYVQLHRKRKSPSKEVVIMLIVEDTGVGIPYHQQKIVFENLRRLTPSHQGLYEGNGIGLYIVDKFVKAMSGEIYLESEEGKGSKFTLALPFQIPLVSESITNKKMTQLLSIESTPLSEVLESEIETVEPELTSSTENASAGPVYILLVEDNKMAQRMTQSLLESLGYSVETAVNGHQAIQKLEQGKYDLVYMDIGLPDIDGCEITQRWRNKEGDVPSALPIVALTAHASSSEVARCLEVGMNGILTKPLLAKQAMQLVDQFIYRKSIAADGLITSAEGDNRQ